ncbi:hypothetical protein K2P97_02585 [bacterium]|nr:hypothetical protein [bacterium]
MDFEIKDLEIIDAENSTAKYARPAPAEINNTVSNSLILNELHKENEELQNKLKLNYRRLLLFETENNKLIEEKNKLFFEAQNYHEKNQILLEKNEGLEKMNADLETKAQMAMEKVASYQKINATQMTEIKRFSKFHTKIQEVVKPFIVQLKKEIIDLKSQLIQSQKINANLTHTYQEFSKKMEIDAHQKSNEIISLHAEKNAMMRTYEEQIHSFSKEIIDLQSKCEDGEKEITRLKKSVEFKNYFENEVIRFKRTHEEDQKQIMDLSQKKAAAEARVLSLEQTMTELKAQTLQSQNKASDMEMNLEVTRTQLSKKIDELGIINERLARLEKLNNQLSLEMSSKQN